MPKIFVFFLLLIPILLGGCAGRRASLPAPPVHSHQGVSVIDNKKASRLGNAVAVNIQLQDQYRQWRGVPYRLGGMSRQGVDCSGFTTLTYLTRFGIRIPRTVKEQVQVGGSIKKNRLQGGDLLFFKTGYWARHVGIYFGGGKFLHASLSKGVIISSLESGYWRRKYWTARRLRP